MRWRRLTYDEKTARVEKYATTWRRKFALWPAEDATSHMTYWFEYVWIRRTSERGRTAVYEVRGGRDCPELKARPSPLPDAAGLVGPQEAMRQ